MKRSAFIIAAVLLACLLAACQPTPDTEFVTHKDSDRLIGMAQSGDASPDIVGMVGMVQNYRFEARAEDGSVHIVADAELVLPQADRLPIVRVSRRALTEQDLKNAVAALCKGNTVVDANTLWKGYFQEDLDSLVSMREQGNLDKYASIEELDAAISELIGKIQEAPDTPIAVEPDFSFRNINGTTAHARVLSVMDNAVLSDVNAMNSETSIAMDYIRNVKQHGLYHAHAMATTPYYAASLYSDSAQVVVPPAISEDAALHIAKEAVTAMGFPDLSCCGSRLAAIGDAQQNNTKDGVYEFIFTRTVNGVGTTFTNDCYATPPDDPNSMSMPWGYEHIRVFVDDTGVACVLLRDPYQVEAVIAEETAILPFVEIAAVFEQMIQTKYFAASPGKQTEIRIQEARLGLCRIYEKGNARYGLLVPAWDFLGTLAENDGQSRFTYGNDGFHCLLTINAIDGSVIDRNAGF